MDFEGFVTGTYGTMYYVRDMDKSVKFYKELYAKEPESHSSEWTTFNLNGTTLCLHLADKAAEIDGKGILIHNTKNLKGMLPLLKSLGLEIEKDYHQVCEGGYALDFRDPSGNRMSLFEYTGE